MKIGGPPTGRGIFFFFQFSIFMFDFPAILYTLRTYDVDIAQGSSAPTNNKPLMSATAVFRV